MDTLSIDICYRLLRVGWAVRRGEQFAGSQATLGVSGRPWCGAFPRVRAETAQVEFVGTGVRHSTICTAVVPEILQKVLK